MVYLIDVNLFYLTMPPIQNSFLLPQKKTGTIKKMAPGR
jgi:hypothetical protein